MKNPLFAIFQRSEEETCRTDKYSKGLKSRVASRTWSGLSRALSGRLNESVCAHPKDETNNNDADIDLHPKERSEHQEPKVLDAAPFHGGPAVSIELHEGNSIEVTPNDVTLDISSSPDDGSHDLSDGPSDDDSTNTSYSNASTLGDVVGNEADQGAFEAENSAVGQISSHSDAREEVCFFLEAIAELKFGSLSQKQQNSFLDLARVRNFEAGSTVITEGEWGREFYFIMGPTGAEVNILKKQSDGTQKSRTLLGQFQYFGERSLLYDCKQVRNATVRVCDSAIDLLEIPVEAFHYLDDFRLHLMLKQAPFLHKINAEDRMTTTKAMLYKEYSDGDYIIRQGETSTTFYLIVSGGVEVIVERGEGDQRLECVVTKLYDGDYFGERALLRGEPRNASIRCTGPVSCMYITKENYEASCPKSLERLLELIIEERESIRHKRKNYNNNHDFPRVLLHSFSSRDFERLRRNTGQICVMRRTRKVGCGSFGTVFSCTVGDSRDAVALKMIRKGRFSDISRDQAIKRERTIYPEMRHPHIVTCYNVLEDSRCVYFVLELYHGIPVLEDKIESLPIPEETCRLYFKQLINALVYLHSKGIVHCDVKPQNLLVDMNGALKLCDFGSAVYENKIVRASDFAGTVYYKAPEFINEFVEISSCMDIWSAGVSLYQMACGKLPWIGDNIKELHHKIQLFELSFDTALSLTPSLRHLIRALLEKSQGNRLTIFKTMYHPWLTDEGTDEVVLSAYDVDTPELTKIFGR